MKPQLGDPKHARSFFMNKLLYTCGPANVKHWLDDKEKVVIVDVRRSQDYAKGHVPGAINLPQDQWSTYKGLEQGKLHVVYCYSQTCHLAAEACLTFSEEGYNVTEMEGGFEAWQEYYGQSVEKRELAGAAR